MNNQNCSLGCVKQQSGFTIVSAVFILVVLAALGAAIVNISSKQHVSSTLDMEGTRAYHAARAGIEWGVFTIARAASPACFADTSFVPPAPTLAAYTVTITCQADANGGVTVFQITATACNQPNAGACPGATNSTYYIERQLQVTL